MWVGSESVQGAGLIGFATSSSEADVVRTIYSSLSPVPTASLVGRLWEENGCVASSVGTSVH